MIIFEEKQKVSNSEKISANRLLARAVSRGVGIGKALCLTENAQQIFKTKLNTAQITEELTRFEESLFETKKRIEGIKTSNEIFNSHLLMLEDRSLNEKIKNTIKEQKFNAELAVKTVFDEYIKRFSGIEDEKLKDRAIDLIDLKEGILKSLSGQDDDLSKIPENSVVFIKTLKPTTLIELAKKNPKGFVTERGGWTSHSFILAREINIPAVTGVKDIFNLIKSGDEVILDGYSGQVFINPEKEVFQKYSQAAEKKLEKMSIPTQSFENHLKTLDGEEVILRANLDFRNDFSKPEKLGAKGIGLFRSEYLFDKFKEYPAEEEQYNSYLKIGEAVGENGVVIRTFDLSAEQFVENISDKHPNPVLGLKGIRLSLTNPDTFRTQVRAILRASAEHKIDIVLPMITSVWEIISAKEIIEEEKENLQKANIKAGNPRVGAMIEVPSAVLTIERIVKEVDFVNLGTNDLVQYLLAVDRDNEMVADWFRTLHPAVIKAVEMVLNASKAENTPAIVCGEMAGSPFYAPILIGLGARELSMNINSLARIRKTIAGIAFEETVEVVNEIKLCNTADEIEEKMRHYFENKWSHLFTPEILPLAGNMKKQP